MNILDNWKKRPVLNHLLKTPRSIPFFSCHRHLPCVAPGHLLPLLPPRYVSEQWSGSRTTSRFNPSFKILPIPWHIIYHDKLHFKLQFVDQGFRFSFGEYHYWSKGETSLVIAAFWSHPPSLPKLLLKGKVWVVTQLHHTACSVICTSGGAKPGSSVFLFYI